MPLDKQRAISLPQWLSDATPIPLPAALNILIIDRMLNDVISMLFLVTECLQYEICLETTAIYLKGALDVVAKAQRSLSRLGDGLKLLPLKQSISHCAAWLVSAQHFASTLR